MRSIWKGSISFGLVTIPVGLYPATAREELKFRLLRNSDLSPINYKRVAEADGREVPWDQIVKGYEYEKGRFVVLRDEDFKRVDIEAAETIDIMDFVELTGVNPMYFYKPYYLEPQKGGAKAYALLRDVLRDSKKAGIAKIVIRARQHLAAVKANGDALVLELMHFGDELVGTEGLKIPAGEKSGKRELDMARSLVEQMSNNWDPKRYTDDYTSALMRLIDKKIESGGKTLPGSLRPRRASGKVIDLVAVLQESLLKTGRGRTQEKKNPPRRSEKKRPRKKAA
jgi:DNA end-binding protein Ku